MHTVTYGKNVGKYVYLYFIQHCSITLSVDLKRIKEKKPKQNENTKAPYLKQFFSIGHIIHTKGKISNWKATD